MDQETVRLVSKIAAYSVFLPALIALFRLLVWQAVREQKILSVLLLISIITEWLADYVGQTLEMTNLPILHLFTLVQFYLLALIYRTNLKPYITDKWINYTIIIYTVFAVLNSLFNESIYQFNPMARAVESLLVICFILTYFYKLLKELKVRHLESVPLFWISTGLLIYFSANLFVFIFSNYILPSSNLSFTFWGIHALMSIILNLFYAIAVWVEPKKLI